MFARLRPQIYLISFLVLSLLVTACAPAASPAVYPQRALDNSSSSSGGAEPPAPLEAREYSTGTKVDQSSTAQVERLVIKNATLSIAVDDPSASMARISSMAEGMGGYVVSANIYQTYVNDTKVPQGTVTIRVPAERMQEALEQIKTETKLPVISENVTSQDVTSEYTDLDSRLRNLEAAEAQLKEILGQATKTEDVLNVFNQLTQVREQIEVIKGQMKYYEQSAALSAITVELVPNAAVQPITVGGWQPTGVARDALQALINTLKGLATAGIWLVIYVLPTVLVVFGPPILVIWLVVRFLRRRKKAKAVIPAS